MVLRPENEHAASVYLLTRRQVITIGEGNIVDVSIPAIKVAMDLVGVQDQLRCLKRVLALWHHMDERRRSAASQ